MQAILKHNDYLLASVNNKTPQCK